MDQILNNKWLLIGVVVSALVLAVGITFYFRSSKPSTALAQQEEQPTYVEQQPSDAEYEGESAPQGTEESRPPEGAEQSEGVAPA